MPQTIDNMSVTWTNSLTTYTGIKLNAAGSSDANSAAASLLMDLQVGGVSKLRVDKVGKVSLTSQGFEVATSTTAGSANRRLVASNGIYNASDNLIYWSSSTTDITPIDLQIGRKAAANLRLGAADAAAPVAQTLSVQSVVAGTTNTAGANLTITGSQGTGTGAGGSIIFQVAPAGGSGTAQNALADALTLNSARQIVSAIAGSAATPAYNFLSAGNGLYLSSNSVYLATSGSVVRFGFGTNGAELQSTGVVGWSSSSTDASSAKDLLLFRDAANTLALRNGANAQTFRVYNTTDGTNSEFGKIAWSSNVLQIGTEKAGTGTARELEFQTNGTTKLTITTTAGYAKFGQGPNGQFGWYNTYGNLVFEAYESSGIRRFVLNGLLLFDGVSSSFPALKRSSTTLQARLADDSAFASVQGKLTTDTAYAAGDPTTTGYLVVYDSTGTAYKIPAVAV